MMAASAMPMPASLASTPKAMPYTNELAPTASDSSAPCRKPAQVKGGAATEVSVTSGNASVRHGPAPAIAGRLQRAAGGQRGGLRPRLADQRPVVHALGSEVDLLDVHLHRAEQLRML